MKRFPVRIIPTLLLSLSIALIGFGLYRGLFSFRETIAQKNQMQNVKRIEDILAQVDQPQKSTGDLAQVIFNLNVASEAFELENYLKDLRKEYAQLNSYENKEVLLFIDEISTEISEIRDLTEGLRQAINPDNPEEILTIARLSDRISIVEMQISSTVEELEKRQSLFQEYIVREIQGIKNTSSMIYLALFSVLLNTIYLFITNHKKKENTEQEEPT